MQWLLVSIVLSVVLTVVLNVGARAFPGADERLGSRFDGQRRLAESEAFDDRRVRVRVFAPWKAMLVGSLLLTVLVNAVLWLSR